jgi:hypothetical protein
MLSEIVAERKIEMVDIYGGEVGLLPSNYWNDLIQLLNMYGIQDINLITNLSMVNEITTDPRVYTSVSYDFEAREQHHRVWRNMALLDKPFSVLVLASPAIVSKDVDEMVMMFNALNNLESVEIKPYSTNQANQFNVTFTQYEEFVKKWIQNPHKRFNFVNEDLIISSITKERNAFSDDHVYITPSGRYGVLEFDLNDNEYFLEYDTLEEYFEWTKREKQRVSENEFCSNCEYFSSCLSEHLREVKNLDNGCNGFKNLIDWYRDGRLEV